MVLQWEGKDEIYLYSLKAIRTNTFHSSIVDEEAEAANEKAKIFREVLSGVKQQPWPIKK